MIIIDFTLFSLMPIMLFIGTNLCLTLAALVIAMDSLLTAPKAQLPNLLFGLTVETTKVRGT
jgi:hypothetical protein